MKNALESVAKNPRVARILERLEELSDGLYESKERARYGLRLTGQMASALQDRFGPVEAVAMTMKANRIAKEIRNEIASDSTADGEVDLNKAREYSVPLALYEVVADHLGDDAAYEFVRDALGAGL